MRKRPKKVVVYEKYGHFFMVYKILTVYYLIIYFILYFHNFDREGLGGAEVYIFYFRC
jgi:hypothetical protein